MRYFFHIRDHGETILDEEGDEFDHPEDAAASAVQAVQELASARIKDGLVIDDQRSISATRTASSCSACPSRMSSASS